MAKRIIIYAILLSLIGVSCATMKLEKRLAPDIKEWYTLHEPLMTSKVPKWIDARDVSERQHFLRLPEKIQREYIKIFWKIREEGLKETFYERVALVLAIDNVKNPWHSHRGRVILLLGEPLHIQYYRNGLVVMDDGMPESGDYQVWTYVAWGIGTAHYVFYYVPPDEWRTDISSLRTYGDQGHMEAYARELFSPTSIGWDEWADRLYSLLH